MKGKTLSALGLVMLVIGVAMILFYPMVNSNNVVIGAGIAFVVVGVVNLLVIASSRQAGSFARVLTQVANAAAIILGICMLVFKTSFMPIVPFIFGVVSGVLALWQFFMLVIGTQPHRMPGWLYIFPLALTGLTVWIFLARPQAGGDESLLTLLTGCSLSLTGLGSIIEGAVLGHARRQALKATKEAETAKAAQAEEQKSIAAPADKVEDKEPSHDEGDKEASEGAASDSEQ